MRLIRPGEKKTNSGSFSNRSLNACINCSFIWKKNNPVLFSGQDKDGHLQWLKFFHNAPAKIACGHSLMAEMLYALLQSRSFLSHSLISVNVHQWMSQ